MQSVPFTLSCTFPLSAPLLSDLSIKAQPYVIYSNNCLMLGFLDENRNCVALITYQLDNLTIVKCRLMLSSQPDFTIFVTVKEERFEFVIVK